LDSTIRRVVLPASGEAVIADTVGFIQDLPHDLVDAFKSTLEETKCADVIVHLVDATDEHYLDKISQVDEILDDIGAGNVERIVVLNKIDALDKFPARLDKNEAGEASRVWLSAKSKQGIDLLFEALAEKLSGVMRKAVIHLALDSAYIRSEIYQVGHIHDEKVDDFGAWILEIRVTKHYLSKLLQRKGVRLL
jgi:GTP-binding protein HflX